MATGAGIKGIDKVMRNLNGQLGRMHRQSLNGMRESTIMIRADMEKTPPLVPVGKSRKGYVGGNLRASWFTEFVKKAKGAWGAVFGFSANYAYFVHENLDPGVQWNRPGSGPKFLEAALKRNFKKILKILGDSMK
jgi:hypothetical protein